MTNLKRIRESRGMSQSQLAAAASASIRTIQLCEQRKQDINGVAGLTLYKLSTALGCSIEDILEIPCDR